MKKMIFIVFMLLGLWGCSALNHSLSGGTGVGLGYAIPENPPLPR